MLLAIDTSTDLAGLALFEDTVQAELTWVAGRRHSVQLLPQLHALLELRGVQLQAIRAIAVARGPGSFTGVRVGLAAAQGLAVALGVPAYGVSTLDVLAAGQESASLPVRPLLNAGRGRFATALYKWQAGRPERTTDIVGIRLEELPDLVDGPCLLCGDLDSDARERVRVMLGDRVAIASPALSLRRPGVLAQIGWELFQAGEAPPPNTLEPLYLSR